MQTGRGGFSASKWLSPRRSANARDRSHEGQTDDRPGAPSVSRRTTCRGAERRQDVVPKRRALQKAGRHCVAGLDEGAPCAS
jgi:hypothetical protein